MIDSKSALPDFLPFQPNEFIIPDSAVVGDVLVLTKPLGTQVLHYNNFSKQKHIGLILISTSMRPGGVERAPVVGPAGEVEQDQAGGEMFHILYFWLLNGERFHMYADCRYDQAHFLGIRPLWWFHSRTNVRE